MMISVFKISKDIKRKARLPMQKCKCFASRRRDALGFLILATLHVKTNKTTIMNSNYCSLLINISSSTNKKVLLMETNENIHTPLAKIVPREFKKQFLYTTIFMLPIIIDT